MQNELMHNLNYSVICCSGLHTSPGLVELCVICHRVPPTDLISVA